MTRKIAILTLTGTSLVALLAMLTLPGKETGQDTARLAAPAPVTVEPL